MIIISRDGKILRKGLILWYRICLVFIYQYIQISIINYGPDPNKFPLNHLEILEKQIKNFLPYEINNQTSQKGYNTTSTTTPHGPTVTIPLSSMPTGHAPYSSGRIEFILFDE